MVTQCRLLLSQCAPDFPKARRAAVRTVYNGGMMAGSRSSLSSKAAFTAAVLIALVCGAHAVPLRRPSWGQDMHDDDMPEDMSDDMPESPEDMREEMSDDMSDDRPRHRHRHRDMGPDSGPSIVLAWNELLLHQFRCGLGAKNQGCSTTPNSYLKLGPPMTSRALAIMHTCMYDAWAPYDMMAVATSWDRDHDAPFQRVPEANASLKNKTEAVSCAAYLALTFIFDKASAVQKAEIEAAYQDYLGVPVPDACKTGGTPGTPSDIAYQACSKIIQQRSHDGSNQQNNYADTCNFHPVNGPLDVNAPDFDTTQLKDPDMWQPLKFGPNGAPQTFMTPHWYTVTPFAICHNQYRPPLDTVIRHGTPGYVEQVEELVDISSGLTDLQKMKAEYWADGPGTETPPGHWNALAQIVAARDMNTLDDDIKVFFALNNALMDSAISCWDGKAAYQSIRPISAVRFILSGKDIEAWVQGADGPQPMKGDQWKPYQLDTSLTPAFPSYTSGHSTFSAAAAEVLASFTMSDEFEYSYLIKKGSSTIEPGLTPHEDVEIRWSTFSQAADQAGISRRYGGIHFKNDDLAGRSIGRLIGAQAWARALSLFRGDPFIVPPCEPGQHMNIQLGK
ncbi:hypothetical protein WJX72_010711 [[Myrmecia] bisecta]|uniref:Vanadium-dependent haloperoxidase n=1 Tax=[Myrmecia] bisecta TaxID=41462 RepID=A0AAW1Q6B6_9CHLO